MTRRIWAAVGVVTLLVVACVCLSCIAVGALYPMPPSYYATRTARAWATESSVATDSPAPTNTPSPTHRPVATQTPPYITYVVQSGDTLSGIAAQFGTTAEAIMELNGLTSTMIYSGTQLLVPTGDHAVSPPASTPEPQPRPTQTPGPTSIVLYRGSGACSYEGRRTDYIYLDAGTIRFQWREPSMWPFGLGVVKEGVDLDPYDPSSSDLIIQETSVQPSGGGQFEVASPGRYAFTIYCRTGEQWELTIRQE